MRQETFNTIFRNRTKALALNIIREMSQIPYSDTVGVISKQLIRSVTSTAANFRAVCRARSEKERFAKLYIVVEEADETLFWLELTEESGILPKNKIEPLHNEAEEILKVMSSFKHKLKP